jgi:hypothetical protein
MLVTNNLVVHHQLPRVENGDCLVCVAGGAPCNHASGEERGRVMFLAAPMPNITGCSK